MMAKNYRQKYLKIYFWQILSVLLGFCSLFIVVPYLSSNKIIFGIYSVCTSLTIFFSYADLGFLAAGTKYAAEYYVQGKRYEEIRIIGFTAFVMVSIFSFLALVIVILGCCPKLLIPELVVGTKMYSISRNLLLILAFSCPIIIGQRILGLIFTIRVEDYKYQRIMILGNITRILSVFVFFGKGRYLIVEYFFFYQIVSLCIVLFGLLYSRKYGYKIRELIHCFKFDKEIFEKMKKLSVTALLLSLSMIVYYELDQIVISHILGVESVALYGAALSVLTLVRTFNSIVYSPYASRYNHFVGLGDYDGLNSFVNKMIIMFAPILTVPIITLSLLAKPFVASWLGSNYVDASLLVTFLVLSFIPNFVRDPLTSYLVAKEDNRILVKFNILMPFLYWLGIILTIRNWGLLSFAFFKFIIPFLPAVGYWIVVKKDFCAIGKKLVSFIKVLKVVVPPLFMVMIISAIVYPHMCFEKNSMSLGYNIFIMSLCVIGGLLVSIPFNDYYKEEIKRIINKITSYGI